MDYITSVFYTPRDGRSAFYVEGLGKIQPTKEMRAEIIASPLWPIALDIHYAMDQKVFLNNSVLEGGKIQSFTLCDEDGWTVCKLWADRQDSKRYRLALATSPLALLSGFHTPIVKTSNPKYFRGQLNMGRKNNKPGEVVEFSELRKKLQAKLNDNKFVLRNAFHSSISRFNDKIAKPEANSNPLSPDQSLALLEAYTKQSFSSLVNIDKDLQAAYETYKSQTNALAKYEIERVNTLGGGRWYMLIGESGISVSGVALANSNDALHYTTSAGTLTQTYPTRVYANPMHLKSEMPPEDFNRLAGALTMARLYREKQETGTLNYLDPATKFFPRLDRYTTFVYPNAGVIMASTDNYTLVSMPRI